MHTGIVALGLFSDRSTPPLPGPNEHSPPTLPPSLPPGVNELSLSPSLTEPFSLHSELSLVDETRPVRKDYVAENKETPEGASKKADNFIKGLGPDTLLYTLNLRPDARTQRVRAHANTQTHTQHAHAHNTHATRTRARTSSTQQATHTQDTRARMHEDPHRYGVQDVIRSNLKGLKDEVTHLVQVSTQATKHETRRAEVIGFLQIDGGLIGRCTHALVFSSTSDREKYAKLFRRTFPTGLLVAGGTKPIFDKAIECINTSNPLFVFKGTSGTAWYTRRPAHTRMHTCTSTHACTPARMPGRLHVRMHAQAPYEVARVS